MDSSNYSYSIIIICKCTMNINTFNERKLSHVKKKARSSHYPAVTITDADDIALANISAQAKSLLNNLEQTVV